MEVLIASGTRWTQRFLKGFSRILPIVASLLFLCGQDLPGETAVSKEYQVKAAFLYNFSQFVAWQPEAFPEAQTPLVIGVIGDDPFDGYLDGIVHGEKVNNHPLVVRRYSQADEIKACHVLFISQSEGGRLKDILASLKGRAILTVSDLDSFAKEGGIIRFVTENNKIRFKINTDAARAARLTISSKLLQAAERN